MQTHWFYTVWPFIGLGMTIVMLPILLLTNTFRGNTTVSRWRDPQWLMWLAAPFYWIHQFEEYSLQTLGFNYSIQEMICQKIGFQPYPDCPIPLAFYPVVNIALMWFGAPLAAYLGRRNVLIGLSFWGLLFANGVVHTAGGVAAGAYNTGLWSAAFCSFRSPSGSFMSPRFAGRTAARLWVWRTPPEPSPMLSFSWDTDFTRLGDRQHRPAGSCGRGRLHANHPGRPLPAGSSSLSCYGPSRNSDGATRRILIIQVRPNRPLS
jgi:hypothetical protein